MIKQNFDALAKTIVLKVNEIQPTQWDYVDERDKEIIKDALSDTYQQGRVAGLREAAKEVLRQATAIDAANKFNEMAEQLAQAAQDEKDGGIDEASSDERNPRGR